MHFLDIDAGGEGLLVLGDDDAADARIGFECVERPVELADEERVERVQRVRAVERDDPDLALGRGEDGLVIGVACGLAWSLLISSTYIVVGPYR